MVLYAAFNIISHSTATSQTINVFLGFTSTRLGRWGVWPKDTHDYETQVNPVTVLGTVLERKNQNLEQLFTCNYKCQQSLYKVLKNYMLLRLPKKKKPV